MKKAIIILSTYNYKLYPPFFKLMAEIIAKYNLNVFLVIKVNTQWNYTHNNCPVKNKESLKKIWIYVSTYKDEDILEKKLEVIHKNYEVVFIDTLTESIVSSLNKIRKKFYHDITPDYKLFQNKLKQRNYIKKYAPEASVKSKLYDISVTSIKEVLQEFSYPFIIKPTSSARSEWVSIIKNENDFINYKKLNSWMYDGYLIEDFIEWHICAIDCYVNGSGEMLFGAPVVSHTSDYIWIKSLILFVSSTDQDTIKVLDTKKLKAHMKQVSLAFNLKNTFICYEYKVNKNGDIYPLEINGRIWAAGLLYAKENMGINMYELPLKKEQDITTKILTNLSVFHILSSKDGILESYNNDLLNTIKELPSFYYMDTYPDVYVWKYLREDQKGLYLGDIIIKNKDFSQYRKDYDFIMKNYHDLLIIK